jgi:hypothetical protein
MLCMNQYPQDYVDACRKNMQAQLSAYKTLAGAAREEEKSGTGRPVPGAAVAAFEPLFFNNLVLVLDNFFVHRARGQEKKDGNPLNEVRMLCNGILQHKGMLAADKTIKYEPAKSVLKLDIGQKIALSEADFLRLFKAFFAEIEAKFV